MSSVFYYSNYCESSKKILAQVGQNVTAGESLLAKDS